MTFPFLKAFRLTLLFYVVLKTAPVCAQVNAFVFEKAMVGLHDTDLQHFNTAKSKFTQEDFPEALSHFEKIRLKEQPYLNYLKGICYSHDVDQKEKALLPIYALFNEGAGIDGYYFNLAYALAKNDSLNEALGYYSKALELEQNKSPKEPELIDEIHLRMKRCQTSLDYKNKKSAVRIQNLGTPINSEAAEYCPLITSNENLMIFTYRGPKSMGGKQKVKAGRLKGDEVELFYEDIFMSEKLNDSLWNSPQPLENINTMLHDAAVSLNEDGTELFVYKNRGSGKGDLYLSKLNGEKWSKAFYQNGLNSPEWEGSACFVPFEDKIIFASERAGGYGGKDLYSADLLKENHWGNIKNLGPVINSKYDEDDPFITSDGRILFFSSNNKESIGGYDIFRSDLSNEEWQPPFNLGAPLNTSNDDKFFCVRADGKRGYYSSYRKGGKGAQDIYMVEPGIPGEPSELMQVEGLVTVNGKVAGAEVEIRSVLKDKNFKFNVSANSASGKFLSNLPCGDHYELEVKTPGYPSKTLQLNTSTIDSFVVMNVFVEFSSPAFENQSKELTEKEKEQLIHSNTVTYGNSYSRNYGDKRVEGLVYKIQVGAYQFPYEFNYNATIGLPKVIRQIGSDQITRFTMGNFESYNQALELLKLSHRQNITDAFIVAFYKGDRKLLSQLIEEKIMQ